MYLGILLSIVSIAATLSLYFGLHLYEAWYWFWVIPVGFVVFYVATFIAYLLVLFIISLFFDVKKERTRIRRVPAFFVQQTCKQLCVVFRVRIHKKNWKMLPKRTPYVLISNHLSVWDQMCTLAALPTLRIFCISKPENFKIPIAGPWVAFTGYLAIDREKQQNGIQTIEKAKKYIVEQDVSCYVNPEGTRSKDHQLHEFHNGTFRLATETGRPLVVLSIENTWKIFKNFPLRPTHVHLDVVDVISGEECAQTTSADLAKRAHEKIAKNLQMHQVFTTEE